MNKALLIGINDYSGCPLQGCVPDIVHARRMVESVFQDGKSVIVELRDKAATTNEILDQLRWLVAGLNAGDRCLLWYSGHGAQVPVAGSDPDEPDGLNEVICPVDFDWSAERMVTDDQIRAALSRIPAGVLANAVFDSCHSGTISRGLRQNPHPTYSRAYPLVPAQIAERIARAMDRGTRSRRSRDMLNVGIVTGCRDHQTSADAYFAGGYRGALSYYLEQVLLNRPGVPLVTAVNLVRDALGRAGYDQVPQLEGSRFERPFLE